MKFIGKNIQWIMLLSGLLTSTTFFAAISPGSALEMMFGATVQGALAELIVRNWGVLVGLVGLSLIYGSFKEGARRLALMLAIFSKLAFISLVVSSGGGLLAKAAVSLVFDSLVVALFVLYLIGSRAPYSSPTDE